MKGKRKEFTSIDDYINSFPEHIRQKLMEIRTAIKEEAPQALEKIGYKMPAFYLNGYLVFFAAYSGHIGFYPAPSGIESFKSELSTYKHAKGSIQFPLEEPIPIKLIKKIVRFRVGENMNKIKR